MRLFSWIIVILISMPLSVQTAFAESSFPDVLVDHNNAEAILWLANEGIIQGYPDGTFKPDNSVNRAELMKMVVMMTAAVDDNYNNCFPDVLDDWYARYVCFAFEKEWIEGYPDGVFRPDNPVNRAESMKIILSALIENYGLLNLTGLEGSAKMPADIDINAWYEGYARFSIIKDLVDTSHVTSNLDGTINFYPDGDMTRKEVAEMIFRVHGSQ